ncbi:MAG: sigma-70 family RNA polymerase sigma factor [Acidobacteriota bacterium]
MDLETLRRKDSAAWKEVTSAIREAISMQVSGDRSSFVEDAVQEALLGLWMRIQREPPPESLQLLAFAIARNKAKDIHRKISHLRRREAAMEPVELATHGVSSEELIELRLSRQRIASVGLMFFRKSHPECEPLLVGRAEGRSWEELSGTLGEAATALRKRWSRCRKHLLRHLGVDRGDATVTLPE